MADTESEKKEEEETHTVGPFEKQVIILKYWINGLTIFTLVISLAGLILGIILFLNLGDNEQTQDTEETALKAAYLTVLGTAVFLNQYGFGFIHQYGQTDEQLDAMETATEALKAANKKIAENVDDLKGNVNNMRSFVDGEIANTQRKLQNVVSDGEEILRIGQRIQSNNEDIVRLFKDVEEVQFLAKQLQRQIMKNQLIKIFHDLEMDDYKEGLSFEEYDDLMSRLDKDTQDAFRMKASFKKMDKNKNGVIDKEEFEAALDKVIEYLTQQDEQAVNEMIQKEKDEEQRRRRKEAAKKEAAAKAAAANNMGDGDVTE